jgi:predicted permease
VLREWRYALRGLLRSPSYTVAVISTLALGVGASAAVFSAIYSLVLKPLPYRDPERLAAIYPIDPVSKTRRQMALANVDELEARSRTLSAIGAARLRSYGLQATPESPVEVVMVGQASAGFMTALAAPIQVGRLFTREEDLGYFDAIVLTDSLWRSMFHGDRSLVGRRILLNAKPLLVIGVLAPGFTYEFSGQPVDAFIPFSQQDENRNRGLVASYAIARLGGGVTREAAAGELASLTPGLTVRGADSTASALAVTPLSEELNGKRRVPLYQLLLASVLLLAIGCANIGNLQIARYAARSREVAIRVSLGAGLSHLGWQFVRESVLVSAAGALAGLVVAGLFSQALPTAFRLMGAGEINAAALALNRAAVAFAATVSIGAAFLFGVLPLLLVRRADLERIVRNATLGSPSRARFRTALVGAQIALSVVLLACSGLLLRSFYRVLENSPGFDARRIVSFGLGIPEARYDSERKMAEFYPRYAAEVGPVAGVESLGFVVSLPAVGGGLNGRFQFRDQNLRASDWPRVGLNPADAGFFLTLGIPLASGRLFTPRDTLDGPRVALVNESFRRAFSPGRDVIGRTIELSWASPANPRGTPWQVVGVVADVRQHSLGESPQPAIYLPLSQMPAEGFSVVFRTARRDSAFGDDVRAALKAVDPLLQRVEPKPLEWRIEQNLSPRRRAALLVGLLAAIALALTAVGLYGVIAYLAGQRRHEISVRVAVGAAPADVAALVARSAAAVVAPGIVVGLAMLYPAHQLIRSQLYGVGGGDPVTLVGVVAAVVGIAFIAAVGPGWRLVRCDVVGCLRRD